MGFQLRIAEGKEAGREFVFEQASVVIGRSTDCDVVLYDPGVSRRHARIFSEGDDFLVEDLGSANGTKVNGQLVKKQKLGDNDAITLGPVVFQFLGLMLEESDGEATEAAVADQSTRIVAQSSVKRQKGKAEALAPVNADSKGLAQIARSQTKSMETIVKPRPSRPELVTSDEAPAPVRARQAPDEPRGGRLSAAERARIRRELGDGPIAQLRIMWLEAGQGAKRAVWATVAVLLLGAVGLLYYLVLAPSETGPKAPPEPAVLGASPIAESFGHGQGVTYERPDQKVFTFEFFSPSKALVLLHYQAKDISSGEVAIILNGREVGTIPPDTMGSDTRLLELKLPPDTLKQNEKNQLIFDNTKNPPGHETWRIWNLRIERIVLAPLPDDQLEQNARAEFDKGLRNQERMNVGASNRYDAWRAFRNAWLMLEGHSDPKPELYMLAQDKMREAQTELDRTCSKLMLEMEGYYNQQDWNGARATLEHVKDFFPNNDQACPLLAERKKADYGL